MRWELDWLENRARITPKAQAVIDAETNTIWNYKQLNERAISFANWLLEQGVNKGDRIALLAPNHISYLDMLFACKKIGAIFVPLNSRLSIKEINDILLDCTPKLVGVHVRFQEVFCQLGHSADFRKFFVGNAHYEAIALQKACLIQEADIRDDTPLLMIYTGGTTGKPKGVVLTNQSVLWNGMNTVLSWNLSSDDITLTYIPMFHTGGLNALTVPVLLTGGTVVIADQFEPKKAIEYLKRYRCTIVLFVPTMYHMIIQLEEFQEAEFPDMKTFLSGGAPCPHEIYEAFWEKSLFFKEGYGLTEAGPNNFFIDPKEAHVKKGSVGRPMLFNNIKLMKDHGQEAEVDEVGEIWIKGNHCFYEYWNNQEATKNTFINGWLCTGDLAKKDKDGYFYIVGRKKDMIITGGENVYPLEVEQWLLTHSMVDEVAVVGLPDQKWGEMVTAFVVLKNKNSISEDELITYCSHKLGKYKIPKSFYFIEQLPKTHVGKIDKKALLEMKFV
ncbi:acyl-CoA synthetase [Neobacillus sp. D3-1R]|uniref:acyl-CoA synthetase n=1 Tax=Neobacillus sp. D3-1R TaxID=3445778 RepID=UPI003F9F1252